MKLPLQISFQGTDPSPALEALAAEKARKLEQFCTDIVACRVHVDVLQKHQRQGRPFGVRIDLTIPGRELVANRSAHEDAHIALREAFDDIRRQLEEAVRRRRA